ncbi:MAG TPA: hypothetical protein PK426_09040 [Spirochaetota bacterium]|nr:hypothetical protein [Spirochaetota bacterium]
MLYNTQKLDKSQEASCANNAKAPSVLVGSDDEFYVQKNTTAGADFSRENKTIEERN